VIRVANAPVSYGAFEQDGRRAAGASAREYRSAGVRFTFYSVA